MVELERTEVGAIGGLTVLVKSHTVDARIGINSRRLTVAIAAALNVLQNRLGTLRLLVVAHMHEVVRRRRLVPRQVAVGVCTSRALQLALNVRKRVIDRAGRAKLCQRGNQRTRAA